MGKLTKAQQSALEWFAKRDGSYLFGKGDPTMIMVKRLASMGLIERGKVKGSLLTLFSLSDAGRQALKGGDNG